MGYFLRKVTKQIRISYDRRVNFSNVSKCIIYKNLKKFVKNAIIFSSNYFYIICHVNFSNAIYPTIKL